MSSTVEVYLGDPGDIAAVAQRVAVALGAPGYFRSGDGCRYTLRSQPWFDGPGAADLNLSENDPDVVGTGDETALAPYGFQISVELRGVPGLARGELLERVGRRILDHLTALDRPLALATVDEIFTDFLPGRGVREFPPGTDWEEPGKDVWDDPRLVAAARSSTSEPPRPERGSVTVFESGGLVHLVPCVQEADGDSWRAVAPVASFRSSVDAAVAGRTLREALIRSASGAEGRADPWSWVTGVSGGVSPDEFARTAVSIDIEVAGDSLLAVPHAAYEGGPVDRVVQGRADQSLMERGSRPRDDKAAGEYVLRLISTLRDHVQA